MPDRQQDGSPPPDAGVAEGLSLIARAEQDGERTFRMLGREWKLLSGVFSPVLSYGTVFYSRAVPFPAGGRFLEIGCGAGVTAVQAALAGCEDVLAVDINPRAVANARLNAARHGATAVRTRVADVFAGLRGEGVFDGVFWNIPYVSLAADYVHTSPLSRAVFDIEHQGSRAYLSGVRDFLAHGGSAHVGLGNIGDLRALKNIAAEYGWAVRLVATGAAEPDLHVEHRLYRLVDHDAHP
ncbi:methyltransferase [Streptomyces cacaoi]